MDTAIRPTIAEGFALRQTPSSDTHFKLSAVSLPPEGVKLLVDFPLSTFRITEKLVETVTIEQADLPSGEPYMVRQPLSGVIKRVGTDWTAEIPEARIGTSGETFDAAYTNLVLEVLDVFDYLSENETRLGPGPAHQFAYLRTFLAKIDH